MSFSEVLSRLGGRGVGFKGTPNGQIALALVGNAFQNGGHEDHLNDVQSSPVNFRSKDVEADPVVKWFQVGMFASSEPCLEVVSKLAEYVCDKDRLPRKKQICCKLINRLSG